jgi:hypothetical protein
MKAPTEHRPLIRRGSDSILPNLSSTGPIFIHLGGRAKRVVADDKITSRTNLVSGHGGIDAQAPVIDPTKIQQSQTAAESMI